MADKKNYRMLKFPRAITILMLLFMASLAVEGQTEFDSLKRNSQLDTAYQPSSKPTFVTEFAELKISGFVQPALYYDNNNLLSNDVFVTSEIPTSSLTPIKFRRFHMSANQSRLGFAFKFPRAKGNLTAYLEGDFLSSSRGAHTYFRLRHAYMAFGDWLVGQTWTNFGDVNGSPNTLDLEGPNSMPASRVAQIRWKHKMSKSFTLTLALEEPKADYTPLTNANTVKAAFPELVVKPQWNFGHFRWVNSAIYKPLIYSDSGYTFKKRIPTWGASTSLTYSFPDADKFHGLITKKSLNIFLALGQGTQGAINDFGGFGYEAFPKDAVTLESMGYAGGYVSFSFVVKGRWTSTYVYSYLHQQRPEFTNEIFNHSSYFAGNLTYAINKFFNTGGELLYGYKENHDGTSGSAFRFLAIIRLIF